MNTADTLQTAAMLASLNISQWTARKHDKKVSSEVEKNHGAKDAGRFNKILVAKEALEAISKVATAARDKHYKLTLPWGDNGERLLPATLFEEYTKAMQGFRVAFEANVRNFVRDYPQLKADAVARLGSMYDPMDYPAAGDIIDRFGFRVDFSPMPTARDFRVNLNEQYVSSIKEEIEARVVNRQKEAMKHCWSRVRDVVERIHERLSDEEKTFRDTLITNAQELLAILPALNIANDPELTAVADEVRTILVAPERLRQDVTLRSETARKAEEILGKFMFNAKL